MIILGTNSIKDTGYDVANSCRFNRASSDNLTKTPSGDGDRQKWTTSLWIKRSLLGSTQQIFTAGTYSESISIRDEKIYVQVSNNNTTAHAIQSNRLLRDISAWYHIVVACDTTQGTAANRLKLYVNGVEETSLAMDQRSAITQNMSTAICGQFQHRFGIDEGSTDYYSGYIAEAVLIDGQQLDPTSFGEFDEDSGIFKPIDVSGLTFGTNGFYLDFENSGALGADVSGNSNNFTVNNLTAIDQTTDTPTNNFATWNSLVKTSSTVTISEGNTIGTEATNGSYFGIVTNMFPTSGKWYGEMKFTSLGTVQTGFITEGTFIDGDRNLYSSSSSLYWQSGTTSISTVLNSSGVTTVVSGGSNSTSAFNSTNDIIMYAWDVDNGRAWFGINGTWQNSGNPASPTNWWSLPSDYSAGVSLFTTLCGCGVGTATVNLNTGNPPFTGTDKTDGNSRGSFEYQPPDGFLSLCTANLSEVLG